MIIALRRCQRAGFAQCAYRSFPLAYEPLRHAQVIPGSGEFRIKLSGALKVGNGFRSTLCSRQNKSDLILIDGRLRHQSRELLVIGECCIGVFGRQGGLRGLFKLLNGGALLGRCGSGGP